MRYSCSGPSEWTTGWQINGWFADESDRAAVETGQGALSRSEPPKCQSQSSPNIEVRAPQMSRSELLKCRGQRPLRCVSKRAKKEQRQRFGGLLRESQGQNLALTVLLLPYSLDRVRPSPTSFVKQRLKLSPSRLTLLKLPPT